ncbi:sensor histidine kinase [Peribacillus acanthi]|uniref:sensor histidine kinase n=1 Tax=Peribacillus acanthi TaxID=2171554 RepID=UPI000D3E0A87|nr:HAMP domain-containing sensor histidine kinase [Peribacillus acanthi]
MEITRHFFFTLSLLMVLLIICLIWTERKRELSITKKIATFYFIFSLLITLHFSYQPLPDYHFDLRMVPVVIGGLYLGIGPLLSFLTIVLRGMHGIDMGFLINVILYLSLALFFWRFRPSFWKRTPKGRIKYSVIVAFIISILTVSFLCVSSPTVNVFDAWFAYMVVPPLAIFMIAYCIEFAKKSMIMHQQLIKTEKLHAIEQMGAAISHEIRNPLTAALGFVQLLLEEPKEMKKKVEYLAIVKEELESAERVIQDYLTFAKPSIKQRERVVVDQELKKIIHMLHPIANGNSVEILSHFPTTYYIEGDKQKFHQCFLNIVKNAVESMPDGGRINMETSSQGSFVLIRIQDYGVGMTPEQLQRLGEPYYSTKGAKGTGLGMMVTYGIVKAMNGTIHVTSEIGKGTTFTVAFPLMDWKKNQNVV